MFSESPGVRFAPLIYGQIVNIRYKNSSNFTVMQLNPYNDFFIEFITVDGSFNTIVKLFVPYIISLRVKSEKNQLKIRLEDNDESFYVVSESAVKLGAVCHLIRDFSEFLRQVKYAKFSWKNMIFSLLFNFCPQARNSMISAPEESSNQFLNPNSMPSLDDPRSVLVKKSSGYSLDLLWENSKAFEETFFELKQIVLKEQSTEDIERIVTNLKASFTQSHLATLFDMYRTGRPLKFGQISKDQKQQDRRNLLLSRSDFAHEKAKRSASLKLKKKSKQKKFSDSSKADDFTFISRERSNSQHHRQVDHQTTLKIDTNLWKGVSEAEDNNEMSFSNFLTFLSNYQQQPITKNLIETLQVFFNQIRIESVFFYQKQVISKITFVEFCTFCLSKLNSIEDFDAQDELIDLDLPLHSYFINSSHNTYLIGHQLYGQSGIEGYERAIDNGIRCVEIDCWDGDDMPIVKHGYTLTKSSSFESVVSWLAKNAFKKSQYPLIISLEVHCKLTNRNKMAEIIKEEFRNRLFVSNLQKNSPLLLKDVMGKVLIKCGGATRSGTYPSSSDGELPEKVEPLLEIVSLFSFKIPDLSFYGSCRMLSADEEVLVQLIRDSTAFREVSNRSLIRVYPVSTRISSSNYDPLSFWWKGCQMAALNCQDLGDPLLLNKAMFVEGGGSEGGFFPKPSWMLSKEVPKIKKFIIEILASQIVSKQLITDDVTLQVSLRGHPDDEEANRCIFQLKIQSNFIHPNLERQIFPFVFKIRYPQIAFFVFKLRKNDQDVFRAMVKANCVRRGTRALRLYNEKLFHNHFSFLLLKIQEEE